MRLLYGLKKGQVKLVLLWGFAECGNRKALRPLHNNAASAVLCNGLNIGHKHRKGHI